MTSNCLLEDAPRRDPDQVGSVLRRCGEIRGWHKEAGSNRHEAIAKVTEAFPLGMKFQDTRAIAEGGDRQAGPRWGTTRIKSDRDRRREEQLTTAARRAQAGTRGRRPPNIGDRYGKRSDQDAVRSGPAREQTLKRRLGSARPQPCLYASPLHQERRQQRRIPRRLGDVARNGGAFAHLGCCHLAERVAEC